jgi:hypothetical protein
MATDNTEPKSGLVLRLAVVSIVTVVAVRFLLLSYFESLMGEEYTAKVGAYRSDTLAALKAEADKTLTGGPMPIEKAMGLVASRPRQELATIAPKPSDDLAPMIGWTQKPLAAPAPAAAAPPADADAGAPAAASGDDAGALSTADGAAPTKSAPPVTPSPSAPTATP